MQPTTPSNPQQNTAQVSSEPTKKSWGSRFVSFIDSRQGQEAIISSCMMIVIGVCAGIILKGALDKANLGGFKMYQWVLLGAATGLVIGVSAFMLEFNRNSEDIQEIHRIDPPPTEGEKVKVAPQFNYTGPNSDNFAGPNPDALGELAFDKQQSGDVQEIHRIKPPPSEDQNVKVVSNFNFTGPNPSNFVGPNPDAVYQFNHDIGQVDGSIEYAVDPTAPPPEENS